ncbi:hypothetical protein ACELLULO517_07705 [Acidisoma cellulosilytica]|uniref:Portal protein n=1 Tax=Acidisoma cellulosilyticum TaxID=2802395 RepID=A0A963YZU3_9PROT|nr:hypothetical protein [Acidisoma cellulosilyticum]MCB8880116.1 hypothetical protein [Acidisoma cellulosilyticum]
MSASLGDLVPVIDIQGDAGSVKPEVRRAGGLTLVSNDGDVEINIGPEEDDGSDSSSDFGENLAETLNHGMLQRVANELLTDIDADDRSRTGWLDTRNEGLSLLGLEIQAPGSSAATGGAPLEGMSKVVSPLLLGEVLKAQATARGELLPSDGPVRVIDESTYGTGERDEIADALEKDMNTYLTRVATEYYPDTDRMLFYTAFGGSGFKKIFNCPLRRRPVSESVDAADLIVNAGATDLANARRVTHRIPMRESMVKRMQLVGAYRDIPLGQANYMASQVQERQAQIEGVDPVSQQPHDQNRTIFETCCELDLGEGPDDMPLPYRVTLDKDSSQILEVRRNWREDDDLYIAKKMYVRYPYIDAIGIYGIGLLHLLGNTSKAMTAATRELLDAGMFACFPGFLYGENASRQTTMDIRVAPGTGVKIETGGGNINEQVMALPYKEPSPVLMQLVQALGSSSKELAGSAELPVGQSQANMPVGTIMAILDQATKPMSAVHKRLHAAQAEEFQMLVDLFREDPEAFWQHGQRGIYEWDKETFIQALDTFELAPVSDPNDPTRTHRLMKAQALKTLAQMNPSGYDMNAIDSHILRMLGFSNPQQFFAKPGPPPPNPALLTLQLKQQELQQKAQIAEQANATKLQETQMRAQEAAADRASEERIEAQHMQTDRMRLGAELATDGIGGLHKTAEVRAQMDAAASEPPAGQGGQF